MTADDETASAPTVAVSVTLARIGADELWELMWRTAVVAHWLGAGSVVTAEAGRRLVLSDAAGVWRSGRVLSVRRGRSLEIELAPAAGWRRGTADDVATFTVAAAPADRVEVRVTETGPYAGVHAAEIESYWRGVLDRLRNLVARVNVRRGSPRQAVIVIHGIGEQEPGRTLKALADSGVVGTVGDSSWVKPDRTSTSFELRQMTFAATEGRTAPTTDLFELYWAHTIRDTTTWQVVEWMRRLLFRRGVPRPLVPAWTAIWVLLVLVVVATAGQLFGIWSLPRWLAAGGAVAAVAAVLWRVLGKGVLVDVLGDAARYLSPRPANVAHRQEIREAGVTLLERLHERGVHDRIVVIGHSLGSVIAYDVLTYAWIRMNTAHHRPASPEFRPLRAVERAIGTVTDVAVAQELQHAAWRQIRCNSQPWLVTDLVTCGSPLTYGSFLMSPSRAEFASDQQNRVLPTCPPITEVETRTGHRRCSFEVPYDRGATSGSNPTFTVFHHAAPFAVTRWTNLYFRVGWGGLTGDLVGGPLDEFGAWIRDVALPSPVRRFTHTCYWKRVGDGTHLAALRAAIAPDAGGELRHLSAQIPAFVLAERLVDAPTRGRPWAATSRH